MRIGNAKTMIILALSIVYHICAGDSALAAYKGVTVVAKNGGNYTDPVKAMNAVNSWCQMGPSVNNPCLIRIMPGVYDIGQQTLKMMSYVDIEGSGENTTVITGAASSPSYPPTAGVVNGANNAEIRFLTVKSTNVVAVYSNNASPKMTHITVTATGSGAVGDIVSVYNTNFSSPVMTNVTISVSSIFSDNYGVYSESSSPKMTDMTVSILGGAGLTYGVYNTSSSSPVMENLSISTSGGKWHCGVYNESSSSSVMRNVNIYSIGGEENIGILNKNSSPKIMNVMISISGAGDNTGVWNENSSPVMLNIFSSVSTSYGPGADGIYNESSSPVMTNVTASVSGGAIAAGVTNFNSSPVMLNVSAFASDAELVYGIYNDSSSPVMTNLVATGKNGRSVNIGMTNSFSGGGPYSIIIDHSTFEGSTNSIDNDPGFTLKIGASKLVGPVNNMGTYRCVGSYNDSYAPLNTACQ